MAPPAQPDHGLTSPDPAHAATDTLRVSDPGPVLPDPAPGGEISTNPVFVSSAPADPSHAAVDASSTSELGSALPASTNPAHTASVSAHAAAGTVAATDPDLMSPAFSDPPYAGVGGVAALEPGPASSAPSTPTPASQPPVDPAHTAPCPLDSTPSPNTVGSGQVTGQVSTFDPQSGAGDASPHMLASTPRPNLSELDHSPDSQVTSQANPEGVEDLRSRLVVISNPSTEEDASSISGQHEFETRGFADHRLALIDYVLDGQGKIHQSPDTVYSVGYEVTYELPGHGVPVELASSLIDFVTKLNADAHDGPNAASSHEPSGLSHVPDLHDAQTILSDHIPTVPGQDHAQDPGIHHADLSKHVSFEDFATVHHFDIHNG